MKSVCFPDLMAAYCKVHNTYMLYISFIRPITDNEWEELFKAAPYLADGRFIQIQCDGYGWIECKDEAEMEHLYNLTVGEDGPTKLNLYSGPTRVYAMTCGPEGTRNENT